MTRQASTQSWTCMFFSLCALFFVPTLYSCLIRPYFFLSIPDTNALDILGNLEWFDLIFETLSAFLIVPLYQLFSQAMHSGKKALQRTATQSLCIITVIVTAFFSVIVSNIHLLTNTMGADASAIIFLRLESIALLGKVLVSFFLALIVIVSNPWITLFLTVIQFFAFAVTDWVVIDLFGVNGVAVADIIVQWSTVFSCMLFFSLKGYLFGRGMFSNFSGISSWFSNGFIAGLNILINNLIYTVVIVQAVTSIGGGKYWLANEYFWGIFLIPILALNEMVKHDCGDKLCWNRYAYVLIGTIAFWGSLLYFCKVNPNFLPGDVYKLLLLFSFAYIPYCIDAVLSGIFIGCGKIQFCLLSSIVTNCFYYGGIFFFWTQHSPLKTIESVILVFSGGMILTMLTDSVLFFYHMRRKTPAFRHGERQMRHKSKEEKRKERKLNCIK